MQGWMAALDTALTRIVNADVDALVVSLGVDIYEFDPLGKFVISTANFTEIGMAINAAGLPTVVLQEGGYAVDDIGPNVAAFLQPFS
jgi:acetoin utilization deacetylase AcuC-like enzyme